MTGWTVELAARTPEQMRDLGRALARVLRAGDLVVLVGQLGAGKTTFTQGLGAGLQVRGPIASPTFVIARVHPSLVAGPPLVHVDAYRLGSGAELDDLDLDSTLDSAVTVVEWGEGLAEVLSEDRLEVTIDVLAEIVPDARPADDPAGVGDGAAVGPELGDHQARSVQVVARGERWAGPPPRLG